MVLGGHGDTMVPLPNIPLLEEFNYSIDFRGRIEDSARTAGGGGKS